MFRWTCAECSREYVTIEPGAVCDVCLPVDCHQAIEPSPTPEQRRAAHREKERAEWTADKAARRRVPV